MKIALIDIGWRSIDIYNPLGTSQGGSETWLIQISEEFARQGNDVTVFCKTADDVSISYTNNVRFISSKFEKDYLAREKYDFIILNRFYEKDVNYIDLIEKLGSTKNVYMQIHDLSLLSGAATILPAGNIEFTKLHKSIVKGIVTLNEWHKSNFLAQYRIDKNKLYCIPNGVDLTLFNKTENKNNDNRILWSSCAERGLDILINDIYPIVKKKIPDFGIDVAGYQDLSNIDTAGKDVQILGNLIKTELYSEMKKHKVWFYPGTFAETFCITLLENVLNGAEPISPFTWGTKSTMGDFYEEFRTQNLFNCDYKDKAVEECANIIIDRLQNGCRDISKLQDFFRTYTWKQSVDLYLDLFEKTNSNVDKKILILTMGCNNPYFKSLVAVQKDTWAKKIIEGKYPNIEYFVYYSCDEKNPIPTVDLFNHEIYVDAGDGLYDTYEKTQLAYELLKCSIDTKFDYVVRTNTSVFVNVENLIKKIDTLHNDEILGGEVGYYHVLPSGEKQFMWNIIVGLFIAMPTYMFEESLQATNNYDTIPTTDDVIMSGVLREKYGNSLKVISPNDCETVFLRYKSYLPEDEYRRDTFNGVASSFIDDPKEVNKHVFIQVRPLYGETKERSEKGHEHEHMYELYAEMN